MNIFTVLFWAVWFIYAVFLFQQLMEIRRKKKQRKQKLCDNCKYYKGCKELHWLIDQGHPLPLSCDGFEPIDRQAKKTCSHCMHDGEKGCADFAFVPVSGHPMVTVCRHFEKKGKNDKK